MGDELTDLQKEWRALVISKLNNVEIGQKELGREISIMKNNYVTEIAYKDDIGRLNKKVNELENFKSKLIGIVLGVQVIGGVVLWAIKVL